MDPAEYARLAELRERLRLTDEALAGTGCDGPAAEAVLMRLRKWHEANRAAWDSRRAAVHAARRQLQAALHGFHTGRTARAGADAPAAGGMPPASQSSIPQLRGSLAAVMLDAVKT